ncbi:RDD family protein [Bdellovibrio bacteriovorus]|uniref:RDD family protein n=1 Tax=Bdellovibrio bacteriovorus TaxID=959 RepID=UPI0021D3A2C1|nr:RDD family protein [Bdellovibrio bacteriovorus]UXR65048.1 RDD family protein [Bdellovibrio bacteriovorus]
MVFPDLSAPEVKPHYPKSSSVPVAFVADRFIALILDFLIFSPIISLLIAGLVRQTKTFFLLDIQSAEGVVAAGLVCACIIMLVIFLQSVFLYFWQATPGQIFMQLRVISYPIYQPRLTYAQCLIRSMCWSFGVLLLAIPFLEILSHPFRRAFPDRAADTLVITLKKQHDDGPMPIESRFISSWMRMSFLFLALFGVLGFMKAYHGLYTGAYKSTTGKIAVSVCREIKGTDGLDGNARLDTALSLFLLNEISGECLEKEAEVALWGDPVSSQPLAYLAKYLLADGKVQEEYFAKVCEDSSSTTCALARYMAEGGGSEDLEMADSGLLVTQFLKSEDMFAAQDYVGSLKTISKMQKNPVLKTALEKRYVRSVWALRDSEFTPNKGRMPASADPDTWIDDFKERYEVP